MATTWGTSEMKSELPGRAPFASFRVRGDSLDPANITSILHVHPTVAYSKGMKYEAGERTGTLVGQTGVWLFTSRRIVASENLSEHLSYIVKLLVPDAGNVEPLIKLHNFLSKHTDCRADVRCFWHGDFGDKRPSIPKPLSDLFKLLPANIELDFDTDNEAAHRRRA
jgi:hypothetical protein